MKLKHSFIYGFGLGILGVLVSLCSSYAFGATGLDRTWHIVFWLSLFMVVMNSFSCIISMYKPLRSAVERSYDELVRTAGNEAAYITLMIIFFLLYAILLLGGTGFVKVFHDQFYTMLGCYITILLVYQVITYYCLYQKGLFERPQ